MCWPASRSGILSASTHQVCNMRSSEELSLTEDFSAQYERLQSPLLQSIECSVCGCDYGGTSWTTRSEADRIRELLALGPGRRLLEVGAGAGWPGLYLARESGCELVLVDLPFEALRIAAQRLVKDELSDRCRVAVGDAAALPFAGHKFDALSHSDVLCCLDKKLDVLRECRRVVGPDGTMVFSVISIAPGLSPGDHQHAVEYGPPFVDSASDYSAMLHGSGWRIMDRVDITDAYARTSRRYLAELESHRSQLEDFLGAEESAANATRMRTKIEAIGEGMFRRELFVTAPANG